MECPLCHLFSLFPISYFKPLREFFWLLIVITVCHQVDSQGHMCVYVPISWWLLKQSAVHMYNYDFLHFVFTWVFICGNKNVLFIAWFLCVGFCYIFFSFLNASHLRFSKQNRATCVKLSFNHEMKCFYWVCPADMVRCGNAVHIWWLCKESQVVLQTIAQWSVDRSRFDICHRALLKGREKSAFPYVSALIFACSFVQMALWALFTLRCCPRCCWMPMDKCNNCGWAICKLCTQFGPLKKISNEYAYTFFLWNVLFFDSFFKRPELL